MYFAANCILSFFVSFLRFLNILPKKDVMCGAPMFWETKTQPVWNMRIKAHKRNSSYNVTAAVLVYEKSSADW